MFVASERAVDGGWHHVCSDVQQLNRRLSTYACWCDALPVDGSGIDAVAPASPLMVVSLAGDIPMSHEALARIATAGSGEVLFEPGAAAAWRASDAAGQFRDESAAAPLLVYEKLPKPDHLARLQRVALNRDEYPTLEGNINLETDWQALRPYARKVLRRLIPLLPFRSLRQCSLLWPGLIAYSQAHVGITTISDIMSCKESWAFPSESAAEYVRGRPGLEDLYDTLSETDVGRAALHRLSELFAAGYDSVCIQERHLDRLQRHAVGAALDRVAARADQCLSLAPVIRARPIQSTGGSGWTERLAAELGMECYGDLGRYCFGFRVAREYPTRKLDPQYVVTELTRALDAMVKAGQPSRGPGRPRTSRLTPIVQVELPSVPAERTLVSAVRRDIESMHPRRREVLKRRLGLDCKRQTLDEIGKSLGRTRERVRQLELSARSSMPFTGQLFSEVRAAIERWLGTSRRPIRVSESPCPEKECELACHNLLILRYCIGAWASDALQLYWPKTGDPLVMSATGTPLEDIQAMVASAVRSLPPDPQDRVQHLHAEPFFAALPIDVQGGIVAAMTEPGGPFGGLLRPVRSSPAVLLRKVLEASDRPLSVTEAMAAVAFKYELAIATSRAHACLIDIAFPLGGQEYGLRKHLTTPDELARTIAIRVDGIASEAGVEELRIESIRDRLRGTDVDPEAHGISPFELAAALRIHSSKLVYTGRLAFRVGTYSPRTKSTDVARQTLEHAGQPLRMRDISNAVESAIPGVTYQVRPSRHVARVKLGVWGLRDRDFEVDDDTLEAIYQWLAERIQSSGPVPYAEIAKCPAFAAATQRCPSLSALTVADLAHATRQFRLGPGGILTIRRQAS
jgi:hypothetical protein